MKCTYTSLKWKAMPQKSEQNEHNACIRKFKTYITR